MGSVKKGHFNLQATYITSQPSQEEREDVDFDHLRFDDLSKFDANKNLFINIPAINYYICGPCTFMTDMQSALKEKGVGGACMKMELFGTWSVIRLVVPPFHSIGQIRS